MISSWVNGVPLSSCQPAGAAGPSASQRGSTAGARPVRPAAGVLRLARHESCHLRRQAPRRTAITRADDDVAPPAHQRERPARIATATAASRRSSPPRPRRGVRLLLRVVAGGARCRERRSQAMPLRPIPPAAAAGAASAIAVTTARACPLHLSRPAGHPVHLRLGAPSVARGSAGPVETRCSPVRIRCTPVRRRDDGKPMVLGSGRARSEESMEFHVLGPLEIVRHGRTLELGAGKQRTLLAVLLLHANEVVSTDRLIDALWGEQAPATAPKIVQGYVSRLRKVLDAGHERPDRSAARGGAPADPVAGVRPPGRGRTARRGPLRDAPRAGRGRRSPAAQRTRRRRSSARRWVSGAARRSPTSRFDTFAQEEIARLEELRLAAVEERVEADLALGRHARGRRRARGPRRPSSAARAAARAADARALPLRPAGRGAGRLPGHTARAGRRARPRAEPGDRGAGAGDPPSGPRPRRPPAARGRPASGRGRSRLRSRPSGGRGLRGARARARRSRRCARRRPLRQRAARGRRRRAGNRQEPPRGGAGEPGRVGRRGDPLGALLGGGRRASVLAVGAGASSVCSRARRRAARPTSSALAPPRSPSSCPTCVSGCRSCGCPPAPPTPSRPASASSTRSRAS